MVSALAMRYVMSDTEKWMLMYFVLDMMKMIL